MSESKEQVVKIRVTVVLEPGEAPEITSKVTVDGQVVSLPLTIVLGGKPEPLVISGNYTNPADQAYQAAALHRVAMNMSGQLIEAILEATGQKGESSEATTASPLPNAPNVSAA